MFHRRTTVASNLLQEAIDKALRSKLHRRSFMRRLGLTAAVTAGLPGIGSRAWAQDAPPASELVTGKLDDMIVHTQQPVQMETPLDVLREGRITDKAYMYIRNNQDLEGHLNTDASPASLEDWEIYVTGLVNRVGFVRAGDIRDLDVEPAEVEMVMQCSGNGRAFFSDFERASGAQWRHGATANITFGGVRLSDFLADYELHEDARFLTAGGQDRPAAPTGPDLERSVPLADVMGNAIIAFEMNGEPIPAVHGGPVRLILPGFYGINNIKWLNQLRFDARPTTNANQLPRYRVPHERLEPGEEFTFTEANSRPNWLQNTKSFVWAPLGGEEVEAGAVEFSGPAWTAGRSRVVAVEVSSDEGESWHQAELEAAEGPYAWSLWRALVELEAGEREVWVRAVDDAGHSQPLRGDLFWNPSGYEWNAVERIRVNVT
jgi:DMSO/TMAO reductase YedYZ molybdopterin-dependent catalytic subunit